MEPVQKPLHVLSLVPAVVSSIEGLFGRHSGAEKKESAMAFLLAALRGSESRAHRDVMDHQRFRDGLSKMIDGAVECLNASSWAGRDG
jgi:hypothetical protein